MAALIEQDVNKPRSISSTLKVLFPRIPGEWYHSGIGQGRFDMRHEMLTPRALFAIAPIQKGAG